MSLIHTSKDATITSCKSTSLNPDEILRFEAIITTRDMDRDQDILEPSGAMLDLKMPLLLFHDASMPVGRIVSKTIHTKEKLGGQFAILNTQLGRDAAILVTGGAVRISHGFDVPEGGFTPLKDGRYHVLRYTILETSLVSVPSNVGAVILAWEKSHLKHPFIQHWAKSLYDARPVQGRGWSPPAEPDDDVMAWLNSDDESDVMRWLESDDDEARIDAEFENLLKG